VKAITLIFVNNDCANGAGPGLENLRFLEKRF